MTTPLQTAQQGPFMIDPQRRSIVLGKITNERQRIIRSELSDNKRATAVTQPTIVPINGINQTLPASIHRPFASLNDALDRLFVYHCFDNTLPSHEKHMIFMNEMTEHTLLLGDRVLELQNQFDEFLKKQAEREMPLHLEYAWSSWVQKYYRDAIHSITHAIQPPMPLLQPFNAIPLASSVARPFLPVASSTKSKSKSKLKYKKKKSKSKKSKSKSKSKSSRKRRRSSSSSSSHSSENEESSGSADSRESTSSSNDDDDDVVNIQPNGDNTVVFAKAI